MLSIDKPGYPAGLIQPVSKTQLSVEEWRSPNRLIFVDDDDVYRNIVKAELADEGFAILDFASGEDMLSSLHAGTEADIIILDWGLEKTNGIDLLPTLRDLGIDLPVVFLTGRNSPVHERLAFQRGAVDFIDKSRGTGILATRLRLIVRNKRQAPAPGNTFQCGRLILKPEVGRAYWDDVDINLTVSEFKIVYLVASHVGEYVPYRQIYDAMHYAGFVAGSGEHGYRANVRSSIKRIRNKFRECEPEFDEIHNYTGFGYCWGKRGK
jgi:two-component system response regulator ChvI